MLTLFVILLVFNLIRKLSLPISTLIGNIIKQLGGQTGQLCDEKHFVFHQISGIVTKPIIDSMLSVITTNCTLKF